MLATKIPEGASPVSGDSVKELETNSPVRADTADGVEPISPVRVDSADGIEACRTVRADSVDGIEAGRTLSLNPPETLDECGMEVSLVTSAATGRAAPARGREDESCSLSP